MPNSPHLQTAKTKVQLLIAIAANDDARSPNDKNVHVDVVFQIFEEGSARPVIDA